MYLTDVTILGVTLPVDVATDGTFSATYEGTAHNATSLVGLARKLERAITSFETAVPFVMPNGKLGEMHGLAPTGQTMLVIWTETGRRDAIALDERVFAPADATAEVLAELGTIHGQLGALRARQDELLLTTLTAQALYEREHPG